VVRDDSPNSWRHAQDRVSFHGHQRQRLRTLSAIANFSISYLRFAIRRFRLSLQRCCQQSKDANDSAQASLLLLPAAVHAVHAQAKVAINASLAIFSFFFCSLGTPSAAVTLL